jgi:class 3 adenylate cyclase
MALKCRSCGTANRSGAKFCDSCGKALATASSVTVAATTATDVRLNAGEAVAEAIEGERKTITALFADIKGSTELMAELDPEEARAIIDPALKLMIDAVHRYDGYVVQSTGDGIFALFGAPLAHEDHPQRALYSALRMQDELRRFSTRLVAEGGTPIQCRVGANTGEVVVRIISTGEGHTEYTPIGHTTNIAARMQTAAPVGSIAVSEPTRRWCEGYFAFTSLGPTRLQGVQDPVEVHEVTGLGRLRSRLQRAARRGLTKFVGREREMEALRHAATLAQDGRGQLVAVMAEPGVGKSRLFYEFKLRSKSGWMVLEALSVSHDKASPYRPVIELLHSYFGIDISDDGRTRREKVNGRIVTLDPVLEETRPYLFALLGLIEGDDPLAQMDGQVKRRRTLEAIKRILLRESLNQPLMLIFEDLHWIDEQTQELLNLLADSISTARMLLLVNYRPEYNHAWGNKTYYAQLRLDPLGREGAREMLGALLGQSPELSPLKSLIIDRTEGNPFFIEEIVLGLLEEGILVHDGQMRLTHPLNSVRVPPTVQAMLAARIDRLAPENKDLLQTLAVLGKEFTLSQLKRVLDESDSELGRKLANLQSAEFIYEQPSPGDVEYSFKHALTQAVAYNSILLESRKQIHERAASAIESLFAANLPDHYVELAHHSSRSGNRLKAVNYLHLAAQQAISRSAYAEATSELEGALEMLQSEPERPERYRAEIAVLVTLSSCLSLSGGYGASAPINMLERARDVCQRVGDDLSLFEVLESLAISFWQLISDVSVRQKWRSICEQLPKIAEKIGDPEIIARARVQLGFMFFQYADFPATLEQLEDSRGPSADALSEKYAHAWSAGSTVGALNLWVLGYPNRAIARNRQVIARARQAGAFADIVIAGWTSAILLLMFKNWESAYALADEAVVLGDKHGIIAFREISGYERGWAMAGLGRIDEGLAEMLACRSALPTGATDPWLFWGPAEAYLLAGRREEGLAAVGKGLDLLRLGGNRWFDAELLRIKGEMLLLRNDSEVIAAQCFRDAIDLARRQSAKSWELRATTTLARLLAQQGRRDEARTMLAEIYSWFTEGFELPDLKDAKALLDELSA